VRVRKERTASRRVAKMEKGKAPNCMEGIVVYATDETACCWRGVAFWLRLGLFDGVTSPTGSAAHSVRGVSPGCSP
jgi:hypothetical protein